MMIKKIALGLLFVASSAAFAASGTHIVAKGETFYAIASQYHISMEKLASFNGLSSFDLRAGQKLRIPDSNKVSSTGYSKSGSHYIVRRGDSLSSIADRHKLPVSVLRRENHLSSSVIQAGQKLRIPAASGFVAGRTEVVNKAAGESVAVDETLAAPPVGSGFVHVVKKGETLSGIASRYGVGLTRLTRYNNLSSRKAIQAGQKLRLPDSSRVAVAQSVYSSGPAPVANSSNRSVRLESSSAIVVDAETGKVIYAKNADQVKPIASITKLMTAMVTLDANMSLDETLTIDNGDVDYLKGTSSRLALGTKLSRYEMLRLALMSSENRAASALARHYPGGKTAFIRAMNEKARALGMTNTYFADSTGLTPRNVSTAEDLVKMVEASSHYDLIHQFTTTEGRQVVVRPRSAPLKYMNSNMLVRNGQWAIDVSKTGYINEAGRCLVMKAEVAHRQAVMVLLDSNGKYSPVGDATRIKKWIESGAAGVTLASL